VDIQDLRFFLLNFVYFSPDIICCCYNLISADKTKALVCTINSKLNSYSIVHKLFGDPDDYAYKLNNDTFADALPILRNMLFHWVYDYFHSATVDYATQRVYYSNHFTKQLEFGLYIYNNHTDSVHKTAVPDTDQVWPPSSTSNFTENKQNVMFMTAYTRFTPPDQTRQNRVNWTITLNVFRLPPTVADRDATVFSSSCLAALIKHSTLCIVMSRTRRHHH